VLITASIIKIFSIFLVIGCTVILLSCEKSKVKSELEYNSDFIINLNSEFNSNHLYELNYFKLNNKEIHVFSNYKDSLFIYDLKSQKISSYYIGFQITGIGVYNDTLYIIEDNKNILHLYNENIVQFREIDLNKFANTNKYVFYGFNNYRLEIINNILYCKVSKDDFPLEYLNGYQLAKLNFNDGSYVFTGNHYNKGKDLGMYSSYAILFQNNILIGYENTDSIDIYSDDSLFYVGRKKLPSSKYLPKVYSPKIDSAKYPYYLNRFTRIHGSYLDWFKLTTPNNQELLIRVAIHTDSNSVDFFDRDFSLLIFNSKLELINEQVFDKNKFYLANIYSDFQSEIYISKMVATNDNIKYNNFQFAKYQIKEVMQK